jgi:hypothetical protein
MSFCLAFAQQTSERSTVEVLGQAKTMVKPNMAILSFAAETNAENAEDGVRMNAEQTERLLSAIKKTIGKDDRVKTSGYTLSPVYERSDRLRPTGYRVRNTVTVETKALDNLGALIDTAAQSGVSRMGSLRFVHDREEELQAEAAVEAVHQAVKTAEKLTKAAGLTIKRIIKITYPPRQPVPRYAGEAAALGARTPIEVGEIPIEASVTMVFEAD